MPPSGASGESVTDSSARTPLPEGTIPVAIALLVAGVASYAFFKVGTWALGGDEAFAPVSALWFATFALAPGIFLPLEQELGRALSQRRALGEGGRPVVARVAVLGVTLGAIVVILVLLASPIITSNYFEGDGWMLAALLVAFASYAPAHFSRGISGGMGRFRAYAVVMGADGVVRIILCVALAVIGVTAAGPYGFAVALSPLAGVAWVASRGQLRTEPGPVAEWQEVTPNLGWLLLGSIFAAALVNAGPVALNLLRADDQEELVTQFAYGVLLARVPLFMFQAVQAALLPRLSRLAARNEYDEFKAGFRRLMVLVLSVGAAGTIGAFLVGPPVIELVYGAELTRATLTLLALSSAGYMVALALAQAVIALQGHPLVALGWGTGMAAFVLVTWLGSEDLFRRVELGLVASSAAAIMVFALALRQRLRSGAESSQQSLMDAITDMPFET
jgi:O-antigen/teichoic acid export membrane protein